MQTSNTKHNFRPADPLWVLLAELSLRDFLSDHDQSDEPTTGSLFQTMRELGMSPECMENVARMLAERAKEASVRYAPGMLESPGRIRIFCQKKMIDDAKSAKTPRPFHAEPGNKQKQIFPDSGANAIGGWGYFMIERGEDLSPDTSTIPHNDMDLYLYKEGE